MVLAKASSSAFTRTTTPEIARIAGVSRGALTHHFAGCEAIFRNHRGRPHWGKIHNLGAHELQDMYPEWHRFQAIRRIYGSEPA